MAFTHNYTTTFSRSGENVTSAVALTGSGEINLDATVTASGTKTFDVDYVPSKLLGILIKTTGNCTVQAKDSSNVNLGSALSISALTSTVLGVTTTSGVFFWYTSSNTGAIPLCNSGSLSTPVASLVVTDTSAASNPVSIRILYDSAS